MRLILIDRLPQRNNFHPLTFCRPTWELRCGMTTLGEKLSAAAHGAAGVACFVPPYMAEVYRTQTAWPVNDPASLRDDDLLVAAGWVKADGLALMAEGPSRVALDAGGEVLLRASPATTWPSSPPIPSSRCWPRPSSRCRWLPAGRCPPGITSGNWSWPTPGN